MSGVSVALVDDHPIMLNGLSQVLASESKYRIIAQCESTKALQIVQEYRPQLVVLGIQDAQRLISTVSAIASQFPAVKSLVYAATPTVQDAVRALEAGAKGYASKAGGVEELLQAIQLVHDDEIYISRSFAAGVITALSNETLPQSSVTKNKFERSGKSDCSPPASRKDKQRNRLAYADQRKDRQILYD